MAWGSLVLGPTLYGRDGCHRAARGTFLIIPCHPPPLLPSSGPKAFSGFGMGILRLSTLPTPILSKRMMTRRYVNHVSAPSTRPLDVG